MVNDNYEIYSVRKEPVGLTGLKSGDLPRYPSIREITNRVIVNSLIEGLSDNDSVLVSWVSPPYGKVVGYGIYKREEAVSLSQRSQRENWGFPRIGRIYDREKLEERLRSSSGTANLQV